MTEVFWKRFTGSLFIAFSTLQFTRLVFHLNLRNHFDATSAEVLQAFLIGFQFDAVAITYLLGAFFLVLPFLNGGWPEKLAKWYFLLMLGAMNFLNCADAEFFKFTARRSTDDLFEFAFLSNDIWNIAPNLLSHFWYLVLASLATFLFSYWAIGRLFRVETQLSISVGKKTLTLLPIGILLAIGARGGFHPIPLSIIDASKLSNPKLNSVALSTPFTIIKTIGMSELDDFDFPDEELTDLSPIVEPKPSVYHGIAKGHNVVVIIVESLATEYVGALNGFGTPYTPFVDSLCTKSLVFENSYANGHRSIEGIAAITASIPTLMYEPYSTSRYASNKINSLANLLKPIGYHTSFVHGGNKNSMNFESFAGQAGYDLFYDRNDYPYPDKHYDGVWGISDHYMLNQCVDLFSELSKPFFSTIFTLSSHHPYTIPEEYQNRFPKGTLPIHESIGYADESLRLFFENASKTDWYENTLFVITADHTSLSEHIKYETRLESLRVPVILFHPSDSLLTGRQQQIVQQIDVMPTVLDLLGYEKPYFSFGVSALDNKSVHSSIAFKYDQHQLFMDGLLIGMDKGKTNFVFRPDENGWFDKNLLNEQNIDISRQEAYLKTFMHNYSKALTENRMTYENWSSQTP